MNEIDKKTVLDDLLCRMWDTQSIEIFYIDSKGNSKIVYRGKNYGDDMLLKEFGQSTIKWIYARDDIIIIRLD
jgi:hypothetical protein